jgi:4-amino-4-deoxy-L-arabinose transferase-like glycosyltransferase
MRMTDRLRALRPLEVLLGALSILCLALAVFYRLYALGRLPGINGDEAWYGVQLQRFSDGVLTSWRTPSGNLPGPLHLLVLGLLQFVFPPSLALLRMPAVIFSLGQIVLTFILLRRCFGRSTAGIAALLTAVLPINIAYARFGWDPSGSGLVAIVALYYALSGSIWASAAFFALALAVHPTNVFLAPALVGACFGARAQKSGVRVSVVRSALHLVLLLSSLLVLRSTTSVSSGSVSSLLTRIASAGEWQKFAARFGRLFTGDTVYAYITGSGLGSARLFGDVAVAFLIAGLLAFGAYSFRRRIKSPEVGVVLGSVLSAFAFFVVAGPRPLAPGVERYALCLVVPTIVAVSVLLAELGRRCGDAWPWVITVSIAITFTIGFSRHYFEPLQEFGSQGHETFWTGSVEPKAEAIRLIANDANGREATIVADSWWTYWPLTYLAHGKHLEVQAASEDISLGRPAGTYWVGFPNGGLPARVSRIPGAVERWSIKGAGGRVVLKVWWQP